MTDRVVLRASWWDGPDPAPGDVVVDGDRVLLVEEATEGAGVGHWTLHCRPTVLIRWTPGSMT